MNRASSFSSPTRRPHSVSFSAFARKVVISLAAASALAGVACSSSEPVVPQAYVNAQMGPGDNGASKCALPPGQWLVVGEQYAPKQDGDSQNGVPVSVTCEVRAEGGAFVVTSQLILKSGLNAGSVTMIGKVTGNGDQTVKALFTRDDTGTFEQDDCKLSFTRVEKMGVAAGRIWGDITCPTASITDQNRTCAATAEVKFENCVQ
ncbi:MAG: hypothetical protein U0169_03890 [Polyangiaceae bacterium]